MLLSKIENRKAQLQESIIEVEPFLTQDEFNDYCDAISTCDTYLNLIKNRKK